MSDKAFIIKVPAGAYALTWARENWDKYAFDFDIDHTSAGIVFAWPLDEDDSILEDALTEEGIEFEKIDVDWEKHFDPK